jgi:fructuronate reductase
MRRLSSLADVALGVQLPGYERSAHEAGIVHLGLGSFHRTHQAVYTDDALAVDGGDWRIIGVCPNSSDVAEALNRQNGLYTLLERGPSETIARVICSIKHAIVAAQQPDDVMAAMTSAKTRVVTLTVTEKAYGIDRKTGSIDQTHMAVAHDLRNARRPVSILGLIVEALRRRRAEGAPPFTIVCCDNLPTNGALLRGGVLDFAEQVDVKLMNWIEANVAFPSSMVDRITPAPTVQTRLEAADRIGCEDQAAVETENFCQWVIEEKFAAGRPCWEAGGALFVDDVAPYERMKLRMMNGSHSMLAYAGFLCGHVFVRDVMADLSLAALVKRHISAAAATLEPVPEIDLTDYKQILISRLANPSIAHETYQIAMDGTEKLPQRILEPAIHALEHNQPLRPFAFAVAVWMRYCLGRRDDGYTYALQDPRASEIAAKTRAVDAKNLPKSLLGLPRLFPDRLSQNRIWCDEVQSIFNDMLQNGVAKSIQNEINAQ